MASPPPFESRTLAGATVLVTGGAGFIGSHLVRRLLEVGAAVRVLDDLSSGRPGNLPNAGETFHRASILDGGAVAEALRGCRFVFHQAAIVSVPRSVEDPAHCLEVNLTGTVRLLEAARSAGVERFVFASSSAVYGDPPPAPRHEGESIDCRSPYAASKAASEGALAAFGRCYELATVSLRYFNIFGPRQDPNSPYAAAIAAFVKALSAGVAPVVYGDGLQTRDFTPVSNVVEANLRAATCPRRLAGEAFNVGTGSSVSLLEAIRVIGGALGREIAPRFEAARVGDVVHSVADLARAREWLGFEPVMGFEDGIQSLLK